MAEAAIGAVALAVVSPAPGDQRRLTVLPGLAAGVGVPGIPKQGCRWRPGDAPKVKAKVDAVDHAINRLALDIIEPKRRPFARRRHNPTRASLSCAAVRLAAIFAGVMPSRLAVK